MLFLVVAFPAALALVNALFPLSLKAMASTKSTLTLASTVVLAQVLAQWAQSLRANSLI